MAETQSMRAPNRSKTYLLPLLLDVLSNESSFYNMITNTYIFDESDNYKDCIFVEIDFSFNNPEFIEFEHSLTQSDLYLGKIDITSDRVLFIYKFPEDYMDEYRYFKEGKYSKYSKSAQEVIYDYIRQLYKSNKGLIPFLINLKRIFNRDKELRKELEDKLRVKIHHEAELSDIINIENETINLNFKETYDS